MGKEQQFLDEFLSLCKKYNLGLWSGEPWYGLEVINIDSEDKEGEHVSWECYERYVKTGSYIPNKKETE